MRPIRNPSICSLKPLGMLVAARIADSTSAHMARTSASPHQLLCLRRSSSSLVRRSSDLHIRPCRKSRPVCSHSTHTRSFDMPLTLLSKSLLLQERECLDL